MFNDVNFYDNQEFSISTSMLLLKHLSVKFYYEAMGLVIVPEETAFIELASDGDKDFTDQLSSIYRSV